MNYYDYMNEHQIRDKILNTVLDIWNREIRDKWVTEDCKWLKHYLNQMS